jgi:hypothetical protein
MTRHRLATALAALIGRIEQDAAGFLIAGSRATSQPLKRLFADRAAQCARDVDELRRILETDPEAAANAAVIRAEATAALADSPWHPPRAVLGGCGDAALVADGAAAEAVTLRDFDHFLGLALPRPVRDVVAPTAEHARASHRVLAKLAALERAQAV